MAVGFKKCPNGHYYPENASSCPYCQGGTISNPISGNTGGTSTNLPPTEKTQVFNGNLPPTTNSLAGNDGERTIRIDVDPVKDPTVDDNRTIIIEPTSITVDGSAKAAERPYRKLVGWLVSYTLDDAGVDFKLYEGRNMIGRDMDCQITIDDKSVSGKHALLLYRAGKYSIADQMSTQGTFVNDVDIELDPKYLKDGDKIVMGKTTFLFRTSLL